MATSRKKTPPKESDPTATEEALMACMAYLHGDVKGNDFPAACVYEYARESKVLWEAARFHRALKHEIPPTYFKILPALKSFEGEGASWFVQPLCRAIYECPGFPAKSWNQISDGDRDRISRTGNFPFPTLPIEPLWMPTFETLTKFGVFDVLKAMAEEEIEEEKRPPSDDETPLVYRYPIVEGWPNRKIQATEIPPAPHLVHALFTINFQQTKKRLMQEFGAWLDLPENKIRFKNHHSRLTGKTGDFPARLKWLASWRIERVKGWKEAETFVQKHRLKPGKPRPFHDARKGQGQEKNPLNEAPLYSDQTGWIRAKRNAESYLAKLIPWEFGKSGGGE